MEKKNIRDCDEFDAEMLINIYPLLEKRCSDKDVSIKKLSYSYTPTYYGVGEVYEKILDKMEEKNQIINIKLIVDRVISRLRPKTMKFALALMNFHALPKIELFDLFGEKERTGFRRVETLYMTMAFLINKYKFNDKVVSFINSQVWVSNLLRNIKERRLSFKNLTKEE